MGDSLAFPKLRWPIDLRIEKIQQEDILLLSCPLGVAPQPLLLKAAVAPLIAQFEGTLSIEQIASKFSHVGIQPALVQHLAQILDDALFLSSPKYHQAHEAVRLQFSNSPIRPAALAGLSYSSNPLELGTLVDDFLSRGSSKGNSVSTTELAKQNMIGLVAPHIDYRRGGTCYGIAYRKLQEQHHDVYVLIGTAHQYSPYLFHLSRKDFDSPLGVLHCDTGLCDTIAQRYGVERSYADEFLHRREHSLELQLPFLKRVRSSAKIVPILVGSFHRMVASGRAPSEFDEYTSFVESLVEGISKRIRDGQKICFLAGVDMAHVGRTFGDSGALSESTMREVEARDRVYLEAIMNSDKNALFAHIAEDGDRRRICGFPTMFTMLDTFDKLGIRFRSELYDYRQAVDYGQDCAVTFAGLGLYQAA